MATLAGVNRLHVAIFLPLLAACAGGKARLPAGVTVVRPQGPPPPPAAVAEAQRRLSAMQLYLGPPSGELTPAVRVALAQYQRTHGLEVTGLLDEETASSLGMGPLGQWEGRSVEARPEAPRPEGPTAAEILEMEAVPERPQPPPGALAEARASAARILASGTASAGTEVQATAALLPGPDEARTAAGEGEQVAALVDLYGAEQAADRAQATLASARREAFGLLLAARQAGGWALLPPQLIAALEEALRRRSLLLRGADGRLGADDVAAIRWVQRSLGLEPTGLPTLPLLERLGIDPGPMFAAP